MTAASYPPAMLADWELRDRAAALRQRIIDLPPDSQAAARLRVELAGIVLEQDDRAAARKPGRTEEPGL